MLNLSLAVGDSWGAGVMGTNLVPAMAELTEVRLFPNQIAADSPLKKYVLEGYQPDAPYATDEPMLHLVSGGASFLPVNQNVWSRKRNVGWAYIEFPDQAKRNAPYAERYYDHVVGGSTWCEGRLKGMGIKSTSVALQGVDSNVFCPKEGIGPDKDGKFYIFSGGKAEYRKGTDVVIAAFVALAPKYPDMHLIAAWGNHWIQTMDSLQATKLIRYFPALGGNWKDRMQGTLTVNGIASNRYTLVDMMPNWKMQEVYRKAHMALFPNRGEAGNNLQLCECMACGIPVAATTGTGHSDVVKPEHALCIGGKTVENDWVEPDLDEVIASVETLYKMGSIDRAILGDKGMNFIRQNVTWERCAKDLLAVCEA